MANRMRMSVKLTGEAKTWAALRRLDGVGRAVAEDILDDWAEDVGDDADAFVPVDTQNLRTHIERRVKKDKLKAEVGVWNRDAAAYAGYVESGTWDTDAQPYLLPAFEIARERIDHYAQDALNRHLP